MKRLTFEGNFCDISMCRENPCPYNGMCSQRQTWERLKEYEDTGLEPEEIKKHEAAYNECLTRTYGPFKQKISQWLQAEQDGRLVVLPFQQGKTLIDRTFPENPQLMENVRVAVAYDSSGIIFHYPFNEFIQNVESGCIYQMSEEAEAALKGGDLPENRTDRR